MLQKQLNVSVIVIIALERFSQYIYIASSDLECVLACQGNLSLYYAPIYGPILELHEPQQSMEKACKDTCFKGCMSTIWSFILRPYRSERVNYLLKYKHVPIYNINY